MTKYLLYLKHHLPFVWQVIEWLNALLFRILHASRITRVTHEVISQHGLPGYVFRRVEKDDLPELARLLVAQPSQRLAYFKPHAYDISTLRTRKSRSFETIRDKKQEAKTRPFPAGKRPQPATNYPFPVFGLRTSD